MRFLLTSLLVGFTCLVLAIPAAARTTMPIGRHGAKFTTDEDWKRRQILPNLGRDQFILGGGRGIFMVIVEAPQLLENEEEFRLTLKNSMAVITVKTRPRGRILYNRKADFGYARAFMDADIDNAELVYSFQLLARDGLRYQIIAWTSRSKADELEKQLTAVVDEFSFPAAGSAWDKKTVPREVTHHLPGVSLSFKIRDSVHQPTEIPQAIFAYGSEDDMHGIFAYEMPGTLANIDYFLDRELQDLNQNDSEEYKEHSRKDVRYGDTPGRCLVAASDTFTVHITVLQLPGNRLLELRYAHSGAPDLKRFDRDLFWDTLKINPVESGLDLPEHYLEVEASALNKYQQEVAELSTDLFAVENSTVLSLTRYDDQRYLIANYHEASLVGPGGKEVLYSTDDWTPMPSIAKWQDVWILADGTGEQIDLESHEPCDLELKPLLLASFEDQLYYVPVIRPEALPGYDSITSGQGDELHVCQVDGTDRLIVQLTNRRITGISIAPSGTDALLRTRPQYDPNSEKYRIDMKLVRVTLATGKTQEMGDWETVECTTSTSRGWLITGTPQHQPRGIYLLDGSGNLTTLLTSDDGMGVEIVDKNLVYCEPDIRETASRLVFRQIELANLEQRGALCQPFCQAVINRLAEQWAAESTADEPLDSPEAIAASLDRASALCEKLVGCPLPTEPLEVDLLCEAMPFEPNLSPDANRLLVMMITRALLDQGAEWIACDDYDSDKWIALDKGVVLNLYAVGYTPASIYTSTYYDSESGLWRPASTLLDEVQGRRLLLGLDAQKIAEASKASVSAGAEKLDLDNVDALGALLDEAPQNLKLRKTVYDHLVTTGRFDQLLQLATPRIAGPNAAAIDYQASFAVRIHQCPDDETATALAEELQQVLRQYPTEPSLYLLLGTLYERLDEAPYPRSRACFNRVIEMGSWSGEGRQAAERLEAINDGPQP
ncbi:hypothetical protein [Aeoliella mucimassa]|uniref:Tetratricopeptide repeat protein n=1 Tax=Aeoliella mucimassa TaxID=2527972 RepID=A0A518AU96_9BACT|nr:hypothetical protein [Aeoliella mucimassa]QDU58304.1 hypothetical protein Pan181_45370 [Aeoliella mucimassa]